MMVMMMFLLFAASLHPAFEQDWKKFLIRKFFLHSLDQVAAGYTPSHTKVLHHFDESIRHDIEGNSSTLKHLQGYVINYI